MSYNRLTPREQMVIEKKATEMPFTGAYDAFYKEGTYICRKCNTPLFSSGAKFEAGCGWPAFDDTFPKAVVRTIDADGQRTEIQCAHCLGHLGHVFEGEQQTPNNTRHCVNSLSIKFIPKNITLPEVLNES
jgi:peptide-methionine (R)-S-oxide reductase